MALARPGVGDEDEAANSETRSFSGSAGRREMPGAYFLYRQSCVIGNRDLDDTKPLGDRLAASSVSISNPLERSWTVVRKRRLKVAITRQQVGRARADQDPEGRPDPGFQTRGSGSSRRFPVQAGVRPRPCQQRPRAPGPINSGADSAGYVPSPSVKTTTSNSVRVGMAARTACPLPWSGTAITLTPSPRAISPVPSVELLSKTTTPRRERCPKSLDHGRDRRRLVETRNGDGDRGWQMSRHRQGLSRIDPPEFESRRGSSQAVMHARTESPAAALNRPAASLDGRSAPRAGYGPA